MRALVGLGEGWGAVARRGGRREWWGVADTAYSGVYGWGRDKDKPYRLGRIEQTVSALRQWLTEQLLNFDNAPPNPLKDGWIYQAMTNLERELGRQPASSEPPPKLADTVLREMCKHADMAEPGEAEIIKYSAWNSVEGTRAHDMFLLDRHNLTTLDNSDDADQRAGKTIIHICTKNNTKQVIRPRGVSCRSGCMGKAEFDAAGKLNPDKLCPCHVYDWVVNQQDALLGVDASIASELPAYFDTVSVPSMPAGSNLVRCDVDEQRGSCPQLVCELTRAEEAAGIGYNGMADAASGQSVAK